MINWRQSEAYLEPSEVSKMELLAEIVNGWKLSSIFAYSSIIDFDWVLSTSLVVLLTLSRPISLYRNQSIDLQSKSVDWFLHERDIGR